MATFFTTSAAFRSWLRKHHKTEKELIVGFYKKASGKPSMTWPEAVDEALCFGWIDGVRRTHGEDAYTNRFTPRRPDSNWSAINIAKVAELTRQKRMRPAGLAAFARRQDGKSRVYTYERRQQAALAPPGEADRRLRKGWAASLGASCLVPRAGCLVPGAWCRCRCRCRGYGFRGFLALYGGSGGSGVDSR